MSIALVVGVLALVGVVLVGLVIWGLVALSKRDK